jgi:HK97 family phage portal protein
MISERSRCVLTLIIPEYLAFLRHSLIDTAMDKPENTVEKSWINPKWVQQYGNDESPVDLYGLIESPTHQQLLQCLEDSIWTCAKWSCDTVSAVPLRVYLTTAKNQPKAQNSLTKAVLKAARLEHLSGVSVEEVVDHKYKNLIDEPNQDMNRNELLRIIDLDLSLTGNSFVYKQRESYKYMGDKQDVNKGLPAYLLPLDPGYITLAKNEEDRFVGFLNSKYQTPKFIPKADVIWFKFPNPADRHGMGRGPVRAIYERYYQVKQELAYLTGLYKNQARPDSIVTAKDITPDERERLQKLLNMRFKEGGIGGVYVADADDIDMKPLNWNPKDVLGTEMYRWTNLKILNAFGLNNALFDSDSSNRAVANTALLMAIRHCVLPRLRLIEEKFNHQLASEFDKRLVAVFDAPITENDEEDVHRRCDYVDRKIMTINEVRKEMGLPKVPWGQAPKEDKPEMPPLGLGGDKPPFGKKSIVKCGGAGSGVPGPCPEGGSDDEGGSSEPSHHEEHLDSWAGKISKLPGKIAGKARDKAKGYYTRLSDRYGKKMAIGIMAAGVLGLPLPVPGSSFLTAAPVIAVAELVRHFQSKKEKSMDGEHPDLSEEDIQELGAKYMAELLKEWEKEQDTEENDEE